MLNKIRREILILSFAMLALLAVSMPAAAQARYYVTLENSSGIVFTQVHVSSINDRSWEGDMLGNSVLPSGRQFTMIVPAGRWDFKFTDRYGDSCLIHDVIVYRNVTWDLTTDWLATYCVLG